MNLKEFNPRPSRRIFWVISGLVCAAMVLLTVIIISWEGPRAINFRRKVRQKLKRSAKKKLCDIESQ